MEKFFGRYRSIVIANSDPDMLGRVQVWCPQLNASLYEKWNKLRDRDKMFTGLGANLSSSLDPELVQKLRECLPWSPILHPVFGMGRASTYNADIHYDEKSNDSDSSTQHKEINKVLPEIPETSNTTSLADAVKASQKPSDAQTEDVPAIPEYIKNSVGTPSTTTTPKPTTQTKTDNIGGITITYNDPNFTERNKKYRLFNTSFSLTDSTGTFSGNSDLSGSKQVDTYSSIPSLPPITYGLPSNKQPISKNIEIVFIPITTGRIKQRSFKTSAELLVYKDGKIVSKDIYTTDSTGATVRKDTHISLGPEDITGITVTPVDPSLPVDYSSSRLGGLSNLFSEYTNVPTKPSSKPVIPPSVIGQPQYNAGGGGSAMNALNYSNLLPFNAIQNSLVGGSNPSSISRQTQGTKPDPQTDPKKTKNPNTQIADKNPAPMNGSTQSEKVKGMLSIPAVGSHVSVYFENGDLMYPVVDGVFYNQEDFKGIHDVQE